MTSDRIEFNGYRDILKAKLVQDYKKLIENGNTDSASNYLYFLRDDINELIKQERKRLKKLER